MAWLFCENRKNNFLSTVFLLFREEKQSKNTLTCLIVNNFFCVFFNHFLNSEIREPYLDFASSLEPFHKKKKKITKCFRKKRRKEYASIFL